MTRALQTLICAAAMIGCARTVEIPLEPGEPSSEPEPIAPAPVEDMTVTDEEGAAGMSGGNDAPVAPTEPPTAEPVPAAEPATVVDTACEGLAKIRARDGMIVFNEDGSATISVELANVSDEDMFDYPGLSVRWEVQWRYASGDAGKVFAYGLLAGDHYEYTFQAPADVLQRGSGGLMIVYAEPFTLATLDTDHGCEPVTLEFSAMVP
jgi:hypothetical protein